MAGTQMLGTNIIGLELLKKVYSLFSFICVFECMHAQVCGFQGAEVTVVSHSVVLGIEVLEELPVLLTAESSLPAKYSSLFC